jgi:hypothetical protein
MKKSEEKLKPKTGFKAIASTLSMQSMTINSKTKSVKKIKEES